MSEPHPATAPFSRALFTVSHYPYPTRAEGDGSTYRLTVDWWERAPRSLTFCLQIGATADSLDLPEEGFLEGTIHLVQDDGCFLTLVDDALRTILFAMGAVALLYGKNDWVSSGALYVIGRTHATSLDPHLFTLLERLLPAPVKRKAKKMEVLPRNPRKTAKLIAKKKVPAKKK